MFSKLVNKFFGKELPDVEYLGTPTFKARQDNWIEDMTAKHNIKIERVTKLTPQYKSPVERAWENRLPKAEGVSEPVYSFCKKVMSDPERFTFTVHVQFGLLGAKRYFILFDKFTKKHYVVEGSYGMFWGDGGVYNFSAYTCRVTLKSEDLSFLNREELDYIHKYLYCNFYKSKKDKIKVLRARRKFKRENSK